jgi:hypothetical protein
MDNNIEKLKELITDHFDKLQKLQTLLNQYKPTTLVELDSFKPTTLVELDSFKPTTLVCSNEKNHYMRHQCNMRILSKLKTFIRSYDCDKLTFTDYSIKIKNEIGKGVEGSAYLTQIYDEKDYYDIIIKKQNGPNNDEVNNLKVTSDIIYNFYSPHFLYFYNSIPCTENNYTRKLLLMEKVNGSVLDQIYDKKQKRVIKDKFENFQPYLKNIISQIIISIFTLHQYTNCYHNDTFLCNIFLIEYNDSYKSYLKYNINDIDYKLELSKYLVVLGDYGDTTNFYVNFDYFLKIIYDYVRPLNDLLKYLHNKDEDKDEFIELSETNKNFMIDILKILLKYNKNIKNHLELNFEINELNYIKTEEIKMINEIISKYLIKSDNVNDNTNFYNSSPYYLNNKEYIPKINSSTNNTTQNKYKFNNNFVSKFTMGTYKFETEYIYIYHFVKNNNIEF